MVYTPQYLAITLPKGYAKEYKDRQQFNSIYFSKLSMSHEAEGYVPILYNFSLEHHETGGNDVPDSMLMTFYYPENKRLSNLNGIIIIGGRPDIYQAYRSTITITPYLESLLLDKHGINHQHTVATIEETLRHLAKSTKIRTAEEIIERSQGKSGEDLSSFFPIIDDVDYHNDRLALPQDFKVDAVFMIGINDSFFNSTEIGNGLETLRFYRQPDSNISPSLAFPLIFKWQPIYNDILNQLKNDQSMLSRGYMGRLIPSVIIFKRQEGDGMTALISTIAPYKGRIYYHVAVANSGYSDGQPLSLLQAALSREKFGKENWVKRLDNLNFIPEDSIKHREYADDLISTQLTLVVPETELTTDGLFDLGKLRSLQAESSEEF